MGHDHSHGTATHASADRLRLVLVILLTVLTAEILGGLWAGSLALLADAGHLLSDAAGVALALIAVAFAARPPTPARTFGFHRAEILAAVVNGVLLFGVGLGVIGFSLVRLAHPQHSDPGVMAAFGVIALLGNGLALLLLAKGSEHSLNVRGAYLEVLSDALGAAGVLLAAGVIALTGEQRADPVASLLVGLLILPRTVRLLREAVDVLLEATPRGIDLAEVREHIERVPGVVSCHDLHAWTITSGTRVLSAHVVVEDACWEAGEAPQVLDLLGACLAGHFDLEHSTFQLEQVTHASHEGALHE
ncbi:MAG: cation efflux protein [Frankiales bacterium]|nr:cation efflux protein [Frankiales bacterium]